MAVNQKIVYVKKENINPLAIGWGLVCWAGSQAPILALKIKKLLLSHLGTLLILISITGLFFLWGPLAFFELRYKVTQSAEKRNQPKTSYFSQLIEREIDKSMQIAPDAYFSIVIPKIGARAKIIPNVDPGDPAVYQSALREGVAHAAGTFFPGMEGNITLFAHSTDAPINIARYNAVFYLLRELEEGDTIHLFFRGVKRTYRVTGKETVEAKVTDPFKQKTGEEVLILQTCWPPGTSLQRLLVYARPV